MTTTTKPTVATPSTDAGAGATTLLGRIRARLDAATPGPWWRFSMDGDWMVQAHNRVALMATDDIAHCVDVGRDADSQFIANARVDMGYLFDRLAEEERRVASITSKFIDSQTALHFANKALATLHLQHAEQAAKLQELEGYVTVIFGADRLAGAVDRLVRSGKLDARSEAGDALLDYACSRHGDREPIMAVRCVYDVILSKLDAAHSGPSGGRPV